MIGMRDRIEALSLATEAFGLPITIKEGQNATVDPVVIPLP